MVIGAGSSLGPFEIIAPVGAGGMGEVYRARDTKLNREVALKFLPAAFVSDANRLARFKREAQTLASLNHPNIAQIYGLEEGEGISALAMEFVEGEELAKRIAAGPVPIEEVIPIARQIAEALESAHEKGIVHRDLKPANIKITSEGQVKLLDFGLATALSDNAALLADSNVSQSPTTTRMTEEGMILGTAAYMSPEQARGKRVDKRADNWAFGVVVFEMITGQKLFAGETVSDTLAAVLRQEIRWDTLSSQTPLAVRNLLHRCLERDPIQRLRDIGEARIILSQPIKESTAPTTAPRWSALKWIALASIAIAAFLLGRLTDPPRTLKTTTTTIPEPKAFMLLTDQPGVETQPSLSPDGRNLVYVKENHGQQDIYFVRVGGSNAVNLTPDSPLDDISPAFSPDGESIAFRSERSDGGIFVMGSTGESVKRVTDFGYCPAWSPEGKKLAVSNTGFAFPQDRTTQTWLAVVDIESGNKQRITPETSDAIQPSWSPHGNRIAYWGLRADSGRRDIWTVAADGSEAATGGTAVTDDSALDWSPVWSPDGKFLYFSSNRGGTLNLWRVPIDESTGKVLGEFQPITVPSSWAGNPSFSRDGKLAYSSLEWRSRLLRMPFDPVAGKVIGSPIPVMESSYPIRDHAVSSDGSLIAYNAFAGGKEDLFVIRMDGSGLRRLTDDTNRDRGPTWTPDGKRIAFYSDRSGSYELWLIQADGSGLERLTRDGGATNIPVFSPDGKLIAAVSVRKGWAIVKATSAPAPPAPYMPEPSSELVFWPFSWSPNGKLLLGTELDLGGSMQQMAEFSLSDSRYRTLPDPKLSGVWACLAWLSDSRRFLYRDRRGISLYNTELQSSELLYQVGGYFFARSLGVTSDNRNITFTETATQGDIWMMEFNSSGTKPQ